jgi:hypothetical protein
MPRPHIPSKLRQLVSARARECCEYCLIHEDDRPETHAIDHVIALRHGGLTEAENLALACAVCNNLKGTDLSAIDPLNKMIVPLFNPRTQIWDDHFELAGAEIIGRTATGRATVALLQLDSYERLSYRRNLAEAGRYPRH